jgi:methylmalonyl-CoA mutase N-terminal domain/subunit
VGVNKFTDQRDVEPKLAIVDPQLEIKQVNRLKEFKKSRDNVKVQNQISSLLSAAEKPDVNLMPYLIACVKNKVTLGEINTTFKEIFGIYVPKISF